MNRKIELMNGEVTGTYKNMSFKVEPSTNKDKGNFSVKVENERVLYFSHVEDLVQGIKKAQSLINQYYVDYPHMLKEGESNE